MTQLFNLPIDPNLVQIALLIIFLAAAWIALRFVLRLARRVMALGCAAILILGIVLVVARMIR